jgi:hypothetical protein
MQWHQEVSHQVRGDGHVEGIEYTPEELRSRRPRLLDAVQLHRSGGRVV